MERYRVKETCCNSAKYCFLEFINKQASPELGLCKKYSINQSEYKGVINLFYATLISFENSHF